MFHRKRLQINEVIGAGRGGRTPTRLPSADFESAFWDFAGTCNRPQTYLISYLCSTRLRRPHQLQSVAAKCTKVGNEQPSKQPLVVPADFPFGLCLDLPDRLCSLRPVSGCFGGCFALQAIVAAMFIAAQNLDAIRSLQDTKPASSTWWLFSPMRGSFLLFLAAISRAPTTPKAYPWDTPFASRKGIRQVCG